MSESWCYSMFTRVIILYILVLCLVKFDVVHGFSAAKNSIDSPMLTQIIGSNRTIIVDINGKGDFKSIQAAIDSSAPQGNSNWIIIHIQKGVYREQVNIPRNKPFIFLRGSGRGKTSIVWSPTSTKKSENAATFKVEASHFIAFGITFKNEAHLGIAHSSQKNQLVAAYVAGDMVAFYNCGFSSTHNTLNDYKGRHYYEKCYIQGSIDFIYGRGQSLFHNSDIFVTADRRLEIRGSITAQSRNSAKEKSGFVFVKGKVYGVGEVFLGRAKGAYSRVIFAETYFSKTITPLGWTNWSYSGSSNNLYQAEYKCQGPGSDSKARASWAKQLNDKEAAPFVSVDFIQGKQWLPAWT